MIGNIKRNPIPNVIKFTKPSGLIVVSVEQKPDELIINVRENEGIHVLFYDSNGQTKLNKKEPVSPHRPPKNSSQN